MAATQKFSNSGLVTYTRLSPNHSGLRTHNIDQISIHCVGGNCSVETLGAIFAPTSRQASSNYGIGSDGRIGMYVEEKNRSWCTSSAAVDQRAVTIEVANTSTREPFPVTDKAYAALIDLCVDICKRNNIKELLWKNDKSLLNQTDKQNMVPHRWTARKSCPGEFLFSRYGDIANKVNARLKSVGSSHSNSTIAHLTVENPETFIWNFLTGKGLNAFAVAGIMGNLYAESGLYPNNLQNTYEKKFRMTDDEYTKAVDSGRYTNFVKDSAGYGLAQWTYHTRKSGLLDHAKKTNRSIGDIQMQCEFMWAEMQNYGKMMQVLKSATSVRQASDIFLLEFERPANQGEVVKMARMGYGMNYYNKHASTPEKNKPLPKPSTPPPAKPSFLVRVTASELNIRSGPGTNYGINGVIKDRGVYTIVQEQNGWGKLKSGVGWIALNYTQRV